MGEKEDIKVIFEYIQRMTKAEAKVKDIEHAYLIFREQCLTGKIQLKGKGSYELVRAFLCAIDYILEVKI